jgi:hypothetical protein
MDVVIHIRNRRIGRPVCGRSSGARRLKGAIAVAEPQGHLLGGGTSSSHQIRKGVLIEISRPNRFVVIDPHRVVHQFETG